MFVVDTDLLIYAAIREFKQHVRATKLVAQWGSSADSWHITWSIAYEFLRVVTHRAALPHPLTFADAWSFIESLRSSPSFGILVETERHAEESKLENRNSKIDHGQPTFEFRFSSFVSQAIGNHS